MEYDTNITAAIMLLVTQDNRWAGSTCYDSFFSYIQLHPMNNNRLWSDGGYIIMKQSKTHTHTKGSKYSFL